MAVTTYARMLRFVQRPQWTGTSAVCFPIRLTSVLSETLTHARICLELELRTGGVCGCAFVCLRVGVCVCARAHVRTYVCAWMGYLSRTVCVWQFHVLWSLFRLCSLLISAINIIMNPCKSARL